MRPGEGGWWAVTAHAGPGEDYRFAIDGGDPLPDPRSPWQPHGVHGPSRLYEHSAFAWSDQDWQQPPLGLAVIYEMHVGTFTTEGTFEAAIGHLGHLTDLGVTHLELMPVNQFAGSWGWGYDGVDLYAPHSAYGGPDKLKQLVNACHERGLAVILDVVYNHLGPVGNYLSRFGPYFTERHRTPWGAAVNFDSRGSDEVRRFFIDNAVGWIRDYHIDGLRLDAVHAIVDTSAVHFLERLAREVRALENDLGRRLYVIAESDLNDPRLIESPEIGGYGLDAQLNDDFHHALHAVLTGERDGYYSDFGSLADVAKALRRAFVYDGCYSCFRGRSHGRPPKAASGHNFIAHLQNHDQIGNRARGERSGVLMNAGRLKIGAALLFTSPFVPMLFQGEEWGASTPFQYFTRHDDPDLARAVTEGRRLEFAAFGWDPAEVSDPQSPETFYGSKLDWSEKNLRTHADLLDWHCRLIRLRSEIPELTSGRMENVRVRFDEDEKWLAVDRGPLSVVCNLREKARSFETDCKSVLLASASAIIVRNGRIELPPDSVAVLQR
jgi:maltooligosyltrehalose trehalohydrolase